MRPIALNVQTPKAFNRSPPLRGVCERIERYFVHALARQVNA